MAHSTPQKQFLLFVSVYFLDGSIFTFTFFFFILIASPAKEILLDYVLENLQWGLLDMYVLLTEDIVKFDAFARGPIDYWTKKHNVSKFIHRDHTELLLKLLTAKCPVSDYLQ